jgi:hypothetical protein
MLLLQQYVCRRTTACRDPLFSFALEQTHLPQYHSNPFGRKSRRQRNQPCSETKPVLQPFFLCCHNGRPICRVLRLTVHLSHPFFPGRGGFTPIHLLCQDPDPDAKPEDPGNFPVIQALIDARANVNMTSKYCIRTVSSANLDFIVLNSVVFTNPFATSTPIQILYLSAFLCDAFP